jgi:hypothetical protein
MTGGFCSRSDSHSAVLAHALSAAASASSASLAASGGRQRAGVQMHDEMRSGTDQRRWRRGLRARRGQQ